MVTKDDLDAAMRECKHLDEEASALEAQAGQARARHRGALHRYDALMLELQGQMKLFEEES